MVARGSDAVTHRATVRSCDTLWFGVKLAFIVKHEVMHLIIKDAFLWSADQDDDLAEWEDSLA